VNGVSRGEAIRARMGLLLIAGLSLAYLSSTTPAAGSLNLYLRQADARPRQAMG